MCIYIYILFLHIFLQKVNWQEEYPAIPCTITKPFKWLTCDLQRQERLLLNPATLPEAGLSLEKPIHVSCRCVNSWSCSTTKLKFITKDGLNFLRTTSSSLLLIRSSYPVSMTLLNIFHQMKIELFLERPLFGESLFEDPVGVKCLFLLLPLFAEYFYLTMIFQMGLKPIKLAGMNFGMVTFPPISTLPLILFFCLVGCSTND